MKTLCKTIIAYIGKNYFQFKNVVTEEPPIFLINIFSKLALQLYNDTQMMLQSELEEMLNYSLEWSEITPHSLLNQLTNNVEINYDHRNTGEYFFNTNQMMKSLELIFGKLSELDYIGQIKRKYHRK